MAFQMSHYGRETPWGQNPNRVSDGFFNPQVASGGHNYKFGSEKRIRESDPQNGLKNIQVEDFLIHCPVEIHVLGSKLPIFPYNRGWSSTQ